MGGVYLYICIYLSYTSKLKSTVIRLVYQYIKIKTILTGWLWNGCIQVIVTERGNTGYI